MTEKSIGMEAAAGARWTTLGFICMAACGYVMAVMLARGFGASAYGVYGVVYSVLLASEQILRLGIPQAMTRLVGGSRAGDHSALEATGIWLALIFNLVGFAILWAAAPWLAKWLHVPDGAMLFRIAILDIPFFSVYRVMTHILSGRRDFKTPGVVTCIYALVRVLGIAGLMAVGQLSIVSALVANVAASIVATVLVMPRVGARSFRPTQAKRREVLATAVPVTFGDVGIQCLLGVDLWFLSMFAASFAGELRGHYVAALSIARGPNIVAFVLVTVLVPLIARAWNAGEREATGRLVIGTTRFLMVLVAPACTLIAADAADLMAVFFGESYRPGGPFLALLVFAHGFGFTALASLQAVVIGIGHAAAAARRIYVGLAVAVPLNLVLVPAYGPIGAALAALLAFAAANTLLAIYVRRELGVLLNVRESLLALGSAAAIGLCGWLIPARGPLVLVELALLGFAYLGVAWWLGLIGAADVALLRGRSTDDYGKIGAEHSVASDST